MTKTVKKSLIESVIPHLVKNNVPVNRHKIKYFFKEKEVGNFEEFFTYFVDFPAFIQSYSAWEAKR